MREMEERLHGAFPWYKSFVNSPESTSEASPYIECGKGWHDIIYKMLRDIDDYFFGQRKEVDITIHQIKEKWGSMRVHFAVENQEDFEAVDRIVKYYEELSLKTCELCGERGKARKGWQVMVQCDKCYKDRC